MFINVPGKQPNGHLQKEQNKLEQTRTLNKAQIKRLQTKQSTGQKLFTALCYKELIIISNLIVAVGIQKAPKSLQIEFAQASQLAAGGCSECWTHITMMIMMMMMKLFVHFTSVKIVSGPEEGMTWAETRCCRKQYRIYT